ncbi:MAG: hypothetical protein J5796_01695 [Erysipelotrichaceae bacterium]|nr:hypothetical protein [Erysipelotrichaceae bacterium]
MKKTLRILLLVLILMNMSVSRISADMGPKPTVSVTFENAPEGKYFVTLLSKADHYGPWYVADEENINQKDGGYLEACRAFMEYEDADGYYFLNYIDECSDDDSFRWSYYPPEEFKIAIYDADTGVIHVSEKLEREAFDSYFTFDCRSLETKEEVRMGKQLIGFAARMVMTVFAEALIGLCFGYKDKMKTIVIVNIITQVILNVIMGFLSYYSGALVWLFIYPILELGVLIIETVIYLIAFKGHKKIKTIIYAIIANVVTFFLGMYSGFIIQ